MNRQIEQVQEFHEAFGVPVKEQPEYPGKERAALRARLIREETNELIEAIEEGDMHHIAKEIADAYTVLHGTLLEFGMQHIIDEVFSEVHRSNMSKLDENGRPIHREDGKVLKSHLYSEANFNGIL